MLQVLLSFFSQRSSLFGKSSFDSLIYCDPAPWHLKLARLKCLYKILCTYQEHNEWFLKYLWASFLCRNSANVGLLRGRDKIYTLLLKCWKICVVNLSVKSFALMYPLSSCLKVEVCKNCSFDPGVKLFAVFLKGVGP